MTDRKPVKRARKTALTDRRNAAFTWDDEAVAEALSPTRKRPAKKATKATAKRS